MEAESLESLLLIRNKRKRRAVSEVLATLIMVAITLVAGTAAFAWINGEAASSEKVYGDSVAGGTNYLAEHFTLVTSTFSGCTGSPKVCTGASFWVFNNGQLDFTLSSLRIKSASSSNSLDIVYTATGFTAYNGATALTCNPHTPGFSVPTMNPVPMGTLTTTPYSVTIPTSCVGVNIVVGQGYIITMTGLYGNVVQFQVTANG